MKTKILVLFPIIFICYLLGTNVYGEANPPEWEYSPPPLLSLVPVNGDELCGLDSVVCSEEAYHPEQVTDQNVSQPQGWDVAGYIRKEADKNGIDPEKALAIAYCESSFDPYAKNPNSTAKGVYQFLDGTWEWIGASGTPFNAEENIRQFMKWYPRYPQWWESCL